MIGSLDRDARQLALQNIEFIAKNIELAIKEQS
jgi:hypothetical protein